MTSPGRAFRSSPGAPAAASISSRPGARCRRRQGHAHPSRARLIARDGRSRARSRVRARDRRLLDAAVVGHARPAITGAALVGLGEALYRLDDDLAGPATGRRPRACPTTRRRTGAGATSPRRRSARATSGARSSPIARPTSRAPSDDKAEIASRLGWLSKEAGDTGAAGRYFSKARGEQGFSVAIGVLAVTVIISLTCNFGGQPGQELYRLL